MGPDPVLISAASGIVSAQLAKSDQANPPAVVTAAADFLEHIFRSQTAYENKKAPINKQ